MPGQAPACAKPTWSTRRPESHCAICGMLRGFRGAFCSIVMYAPREIVFVCVSGGGGGQTCHIFLLHITCK